MQRLCYGTTSRIAVSRVISPSSNFKKSRSGGEGYKVKYNNFKSSSLAPSRPDAYDLCIKAKAIARSSGAEPALLYALNQLPSPALKSASPSSSSGSSKPVLLNTVLTALSREGKGERFWEVFGAKIDGNKTNWSPQLAATLLNQIAKEMEHLEDATEKNLNDETKANVIDENKINVASDVAVKRSKPSIKNIDELMKKATSIYIEALETIKVPNHLHLHNAFLKCISRSQNVPFLLWIINKMTPGHFGDINLKVMGIRDFIPVTEDALKLVKLLETLERPVELDAQSLTSILATLARSFDGSITLAETLWSKFQSLKSPQIILDKHCHLALLLVYRNDLSRILRQRKLIRSCSWRERKHTRVLEIIKSAGVDLCKDAKFLSIYYEICLNAKLREKVQAHVQQNPQRIQDKRVFDLIKKSQKGI